MKLCKDCKNYIRGQYYPTPRCKTEDKSPVTGESVLKSCLLERTKSFGSCGPDAKRFVPKVKSKSLWEKLFSGSTESRGPG